MRRSISCVGLFIVVLVFPFFLIAQKVTLNPTITPALFKYNDQITVTYDVTGTSLASLNTAWIWVWIPNATAINAKYNVNPSTSAADPAKFTKSVVSGKTLFTITFKPSDFFSSDISAQTQIGMLLKANDWSNGQTSDYLASFWDGSFQVKLVSPNTQPLFVTPGDAISIQAQTPLNADFELTVNGNPVDTQTDITNYSYSLIATSSYSTVVIKATLSGTATTSQTSFNYLPSTSSPVMSRPQGIIDGINYDPADPTKVTLSLWAPNKTSVYALGDFSDWNVTPTYLMNRDGEHFWLEITNLTSGQEYAFQYLVDQTIYVADPYADKLLSTDDQYIPSTTYPNLKTFPAKAVHADFYFNWLSVFQTNQTPYNWQVTNFQKPAKEKLVIYDLLIRDFFDSNHRNYQTLIDTINYFKRLGINAIQLMPIMEFSGNDSWGYNPDFMFAPDKYYGTKNKLKEFVDVCHQNGIAVILDIVLNHQDMFSPYALMYYDLVNYKPLPSNPWFNVTAPHPYSVFNDLNHTSSYTRKFVDTVSYHWLSEYKVDGFRYDLSKGFTQTSSTENTVGNYDQSRIDNITRMADVIWSNFPDAYVILEHFADNSEETVLANYKAAEGKGMMPWANLNYAYNRATMGYAEGSDFSGIYYGSKGWTLPRAIGYMESHDEERLMYKNITYGNSSGSYNVKTLSTALQRMKAAALSFYTVPGPKMLWEFGEWGYDKSINTCTDGTINNNCRLAAKPVGWLFNSDADRKSLHDFVKDVIRIRNSYPLFTNGTLTLQTSSGSLVKQLVLKGNPYTDSPSDSSRMNAVVVTNFDVTQQSSQVSFPHAGTWYDYYNPGAALTVNAVPFTIPLQPGQYKLFTDVRIKTSGIVTAIQDFPSKEVEVSIYPNPTHGLIKIESSKPISNLMLMTATGAAIPAIRLDDVTWDIGNFPSGLYIVEMQTSIGVVRRKIILN